MRFGHVEPGHVHPAEPSHPPCREPPRVLLLPRSHRPRSLHIPYTTLLPAPATPGGVRSCPAKSRSSGRTCPPSVPRTPPGSARTPAPPAPPASDDRPQTPVGPGHPGCGSATSSPATSIQPNLPTRRAANPPGFCSYPGPTGPARFTFPTRRSSQLLPPRVGYVHVQPSHVHPAELVHRQCREHPRALLEHRPHRRPRLQMIAPKPRSAPATLDAVRPRRARPRPSSRTFPPAVPRTPPGSALTPVPPAPLASHSLHDAPPSSCHPGWGTFMSSQVTFIRPNLSTVSAANTPGLCSNTGPTGAPGFR